MNVLRNRIFTIGHSTHSMEELLTLLSRHEVNVVADVRSAPYSKFNPQFNKENLRRNLEASGIQYVFLGRELGARSEDKSCYENGRVRYERLAQTDLFHSGIERIIRGAEKYHIALLCAEKEPLECHRTLLVSKALAERGLEVAHILADGRIESHEETMNRLLYAVGLPVRDLFRSREQLISEALLRQEEKVAYVEENTQTDYGSKTS
jgi:uncharacterized protein (DUF488 family)